MIKQELSDHRADCWEPPQVEIPLSASLTRYLDYDPRPFWYYRNYPKIDQVEGRCRCRSSRVVRHRACSEMCTKCVWITEGYRNFANESVYDIERSFSDRDTVSPVTKKKRPVDKAKEQRSDDCDDSDSDDDAQSFYSVQSSMSDGYSSCHNLSGLQDGNTNGPVVTEDAMPQLKVIEIGIPVTPSLDKTNVNKPRLDNLFDAHKKLGHWYFNAKKRDFADDVENVMDWWKDSEEEDKVKTKREKRHKGSIFKRLKKLFCCFC